MTHLDVARSVGRPPVGPCPLTTSDDMLRPLMPLEANERGSTEVRLANVTKRLGERVCFGARGRRLDSSLADPLNAAPRVELRDDVGMQAVHDLPSATSDIQRV